MAGNSDERMERLGREVAARGVLRLKDAAALLGVSEMTVRRDLAGARDRLTYLGGHIVAQGDGGPQVPYQFEREADSRAASKRAACAHAVPLIAPDSTIFIDCGTTLAHLAEQLPTGFALTVLCYSLNVAERVAHRSDIRLILLGGLYHPESASFAGDAGASLSWFGINTAFISAGGVDPARGVSCSHLHEVPIKQQAMACAQASYLVIDGSKKGRVRPALFAGLDDFAGLVTEDGLQRFPGRSAAPAGGAT
ncbi:DeoR/GlpR family DNA-binding transcription regulator [Oryzibacter oryziterrae]|uniref:DeoR/GlpR family DNA-binding transcription regulator n=1 Tax=Oryzibacter oryziterrae TaxID=2766474 RepID=UPI001F1C1642|nr:DeoR/GlpR family DNA-binding transcription regulator [Oryzibacter oryziterrae]